MSVEIEVAACRHITHAGPSNVWGGMYLCDDCLDFIKRG